MKERVSIKEYRSLSKLFHALANMAVLCKAGYIKSQYQANYLLYTGPFILDIRIRAVVHVKFVVFRLPRVPSRVPNTLDARSE
jgi:hypothetical protein